MDLMDVLRGYADARAGVSPTVARFDAERELLRRDPVLALLLRIEAIAGMRADNHCHALAKCALIDELARDAVVAYTGRSFDNPLYPVDAP